MGPRITKVNTRFHQAHLPGLKLAITLRHLATANSYHGLAFSFRVPYNSISKIVREVCTASIKAPKESGTLYPNYKGFFSMILLAVVDADYKLMGYSIGAHGSKSDCAVLNASTLKAAVEANLLNIPPPEPLQNDDRPMPSFPRR